MYSLKNRIAVVSGASSGIGKAIALGLANEGVRVCIVGRSLEKLHAVAGCAKQFSENISTYKTDLEIDKEISSMAVDIHTNIRRNRYINTQCRGHYY